MAIREVELPGVGKKYTVETEAKGQVVIVLHRTGKREIYHFSPSQKVPGEVINLTADEAQHIGGILSQTYFQAVPDASRELVMKGLTMEWLTLEAAHPMANRNIRELAVRKQTGATIIAILRDGKAVVNPDPDEMLREEDTLMVIGTAEQVQSFLTTFKLPASSS